MKTFFVTFGMGTILRGYYLTVEAENSDIVMAWLIRKEKTRFSAIRNERPTDMKELQERPEVLCYSHADHI